MTPNLWPALGNAFAPFDPVPPNKLREWFVERPNEMVEYLVRLLSPEKIPRRHILVGQPACGKSSELTKLAAELRERDNALVVRFDMTDNTDVERANPVEVLFLMGAAIFKVATNELPSDHPPDRRLLEELAQGLETLVREHTDNKSYAIDIDKLLGGLLAFGGAILAGPGGAVIGATISTQTAEAAKTLIEKFMPFRFTSGTDTQVVRKLEVEPKVEAMVEGLNKIIDDVQSRTDRPLVLLVDGLDKLRDEAVISLNFLEKNFLNGPRCRILYTGPLDLYYSPQFGEVRNRFAIFPFSHVKLYEREAPNTRDTQGYEFMRMVVSQRLQSLNQTVEAVFAPEVLDLLIKGSGGVMRDLIRLVEAAALQAEVKSAPRIEMPEARKALNELRRQLLAQLDPDYHAVLDKVRATRQRVGGNEDGKRCDQLLRNGIVLAYINNTNDDIWFDVHSALTPEPW